MRQATWLRNMCLLICSVLSQREKETARRFSVDCYWLKIIEIQVRSDIHLPVKLNVYRSLSWWCSIYTVHWQTVHNTSHIWTVLNKFKFNYVLVVQCRLTLDRYYTHTHTHTHTRTHARTHTLISMSNTVKSDLWSELCRFPCLCQTEVFAL